MKEEKIVSTEWDFGTLCTIDALGDSEFPEQVCDEVAELFNKLYDGYTLVCYDCIITNKGNTITNK